MNARGIPLLLVDDNPVVRQNVQRFAVKHPNIQIVGHAGNHEEALERVRTLRPKVVLININMPRMNAVITCREIRLQDPSIIVIGLNITTQEDQRLHLSERQKASVKNFRALGEPLLHATWRIREPRDSALPPCEPAC